MSMNDQERVYVNDEEILLVAGTGLFSIIAERNHEPLPSHVKPDQGQLAFTRGFFSTILAQTRVNKTALQTILEVMGDEEIWVALSALGNDPNDPTPAIGVTVQSSKSTGYLFPVDIPSEA